MDPNTGRQKDGYFDKLSIPPILCMVDGTKRMRKNNIPIKQSETRQKKTSMNKHSSFDLQSEFVVRKVSSCFVLFFF